MMAVPVVPRLPEENVGRPGAARLALVGVVTGRAVPPEVLHRAVARIAERRRALPDVLQVTDTARSKAVYTQALAPLGISLVMEHGAACGFGRNGKPELWIGSGGMDFQTPDQVRVLTPVHVCLTEGPCRGGRVLRRGRTRQRTAGHPRHLPSQLLRSLRARPRRPQRRSGRPHVAQPYACSSGSTPLTRKSCVDLWSSRQHCGNRRVRPLLHLLWLR